GDKTIAPEQWYAGVIYSIMSSLELYDFDLTSWWDERSLLPYVQRFNQFIEEVLLQLISQPIVIFFDEIDSILQLSFRNEFLLAIQVCYNKRAQISDYQRLTFALLGVATPTDLIANKKRTPFNIGRAIRLRGFQLHEAQPLAQGLAKKFSNPQAVLKRVLQWTGGQPFLTQKLCQLLQKIPTSAQFQDEAAWVDKVVRSQIIDNWESQDEPEHLRTIRDRVLHGTVREPSRQGKCDRILNEEQRATHLLELYQEILQYGEVPVNDSSEQMELRLSGLVVEHQGKLRVYNRIYQLVFDRAWIVTALQSIKKYQAKQFSILLIIKDQKGRREFTLDKDEYSIGRDTNSDICIFSEFVSRRHATLIRQQHEDGSPYYQLMDGNGQGKRSSNGVWINRKKIESHNLQDEDEILFGLDVGATYYMIRKSTIHPSMGKDEDSTRSANLAKIN
ncbi:MAG TPA: AAA-like domain-containing protein, partial [Allocoleopsis sp.]